MSTMTICHHLFSTADRLADKTAIMVCKKGNWISYTWIEYLEKISKVAFALSKEGIKKGSKVAILSSTRAEWSYCDHAILGLGGITIPIYQNITADDLLFYLQDSGAELLFLESKQHLQLWETVKDQCPQVKKVIGFPGLIKGVDTTWRDFLDDIDKQEAKELFQKEIQNRKLSEIATIVYTSGTGGTPKGVVHTHKQVMSEVSECFPLFDVTQKDVTLSFLPYAHILGRVEHWGHVFCGFQMAYAESFERIKLNIQSIQPTVLIAVPRIFEKIYSRIVTQAQANLAKRKLFDWAIGVGREMSRHRAQNKSIPPHLFIQFQAAQRLVFRPIYNSLGGRIRFAICGGAPLAQEVAEFFDALGVLILEGYGLTETTAAIFVNRPFDYEFGTVGKAVGDVQIKIAKDGEILIKSDKVMKEYYNRLEDTQEAIKAGWFHTGDIGELSEQGRLRITDRKKDLIKTAAGKYVAPQKLEKLLKQHPLVSHVLIHGDKRKYVVALITLDEVALKGYAENNDIYYRDAQQLAAHGDIQKEMRKHVSEVNSKLANFETIKKFKILAQDFTIEAGELTNSMKVKRKFCDQKYQDQLNSLYT